jgi:nucleotide-binding universal stress UspA family protein
VTNIQKILVYIDFTDLSKKSLEWAVFFAKRFNRELHLLHVINNNTYNYFDKNNIYNGVMIELKNISLELKNKYGIKSEYSSKEGCTCTIINSTAEHIDAFMIILATHGKNELQFLSSQEIVKIVRKSQFPYFVIQPNSPLPADGKRIALPIGANKETKEKAGWVSYFGKHLSTEIDIIYEDIDNNNIDNNILFCIKFFKELSINYNKSVLKKSWKDINAKVLKYIKTDEFLLMVITTTKSENLGTKLFGFPETNTISNSHGLPVLCINPKKNLYIPCI